jgi:anti-sigma regulatory factor (Ser/Thr protein kinase)
MLNLQLQATAAEVMRAVEVFRDFCQSHGVPERTAFGLAVALEECGSNIVNYALRGDAQQTFALRVEYTPEEISIELRDRGPEFDPTLAKEKPQGVPDDEPPGGWGIPLVRRYTDDFVYKREADQNILRFSRRLAGKAGSS